MVAKVSIADAAKADMAAISQWYESQRSGLSARFLKELDAAVEAIQGTPELARIRYDDVRVYCLKSYPYLVHYHIHPSGTVVTIVRILHRSRNTDWS